MGKLAFIYPGQGAQKAGMGLDFDRACPEAAAVFDRAREVLDFDIRQICFEGGSLLDRTDYTQPALVTACLAMTAALEAMGVVPDVTAGLSLGEYAAIAAAGGMSYADAIRAVRARGIFMNEAVPDGQGAMMAVLGLTGEAAARAIAPIDGIWVANYNCPGQIVITGRTEAMPAAEKALTEAGARRVMALNVSGPFHSPMLSEAGEKLAAVLRETPFTPLDHPYVTNVTADYVTDVGESAGLLVRQVSSSVLWEQSMRRLIADGVDTFVEIGPGKTLAGFMKKIDRSVRVISISCIEDLKKVEMLHT